MSAIRRGLHTVQVRTRVKTTDKYGEVVSELSPEAVQVQCNVQPASAEETELLAGAGATTVYRVKYWPNEHGGAPWPGGPYSQIVIDGKAYEQRGEALKSRMSGTTGHIKIYAAAYDSEAK